MENEEEIIEEKTDQKDLNVNVYNVGIVGASGGGKSYFCEHDIFPLLNKSMLIIDVKNQYKHLTKEGYEIYQISDKEKDPFHRYLSIIKNIKMRWKLKGKCKFIIRWFPDDILEIDFNRIMKHWTELGNNTTVLEEAHEFKRSAITPYKEFEKTLRKRTGLHNKNANVIWITQFPNDVPKCIYGNTQILIVFEHWENVLQQLEHNKTIPNTLSFDKDYQYHVVAR